MKLVIQGTKSFRDYPVFMRAMSVALSDLAPDEGLDIYTLGAFGLNANAMEFFNKTRMSLKQRGVNMNLYRVNSMAVEDPEKFDKLYFFCNNGERLSDIGKKFDKAGKETLIFKG